MTLKLLQDPERLIEAFCQDCAIRGMTTETMRGYRSNLGIFAEYFTNVNILDINMERLRAFLVYLKQERGVKQKTVEQYFSALSAFYDYLVFEERTSQNIVLAFRRRYLKMYKKEYDSPQKKLLTREEMSQLVHSILDPRDKVIAVLLAKTGVRRGELLKMDVGDINWRDYSITLKPAPKRSNRVVFFDEEGARVLRRWLKTREQLTPSTKALFISYQTLNKLSRNGAYQAVVKYAKRLGFQAFQPGVLASFRKAGKAVA